MFGMVFCYKDFVPILSSFGILTYSPKFTTEIRQGIVFFLSHPSFHAGDMQNIVCKAVVGIGGIYALFAGL